MSYDLFVLSDRHARQRQQEILREVEQIRLANQVASTSAQRPRLSVRHLLASLVVMLQR
jgi:hypothetical protein